MSDPIDRQAAIDVVMKMPTFEDTSKEKLIHQHFTKMKLELLPAVNAIPVEWIEKKIAWLAGLDNAFSGLAASSLRAMLASWRKENGDEETD